MLNFFTRLSYVKYYDRDDGLLELQNRVCVFVLAWPMFNVGCINGIEQQKWNRAIACLHKINSRHTGRPSKQEVHSAPGASFEWTRPVRVAL